MTDDNRALFAKLIYGLFAGYPSAKCNAGTVQAYWWLLKGYSYEAVKEGVREAAKASPDYVPSASRLRLHVQAVQRQMAERSLPAHSPALLTNGVGPEQDTPIRRRCRELGERWDRGEEAPSFGAIVQALADDKAITGG